MKARDHQIENLGKGGMIVGTSGENTTLSIGSNGQVLTADSTQTEGLKWADITCNAPSATQMVYFEDFNWSTSSNTGSILFSDYWIAGNSGEPAGVAILATSNGTLRLQTGGGASWYAYAMWVNQCFDNDLLPTIEFLFRANTSISGVRVEGGFYKDTSNYDYMLFDSAIDANNIYLATNKSGAGEVRTDSGIDLTASTWTRIKIQNQADDSVKMWINDNLVVTTASSVINDLATNVPWFRIIDRGAGTNRVMEIDFVKISQNRS